MRSKGWGPNLEEEVHRRKAVQGHSEKAKTKVSPHTGPLILELQFLEL